jgi:hypothetical protein
MWKNRGVLLRVEHYELVEKDDGCHVWKKPFKNEVN